MYSDAEAIGRRNLSKTKRNRSDIPYAETIDPTEVQLWKKSYEMADQGTALENFKWIYGAAAKLAYGL